MMGAKCNNNSPLEAGFSLQLNSCRQSVRWDEEICVVLLCAENICAVLVVSKSVSKFVSKKNPSLWYACVIASNFHVDRKFLFQLDIFLWWTHIYIQYSAPRMLLVV